MNIVTRAEAIKKGRKTYFTGRPCKHGHISERYVSSRVCVECQKGSNARWLQKFPNAEDREAHAEASYKYRRQRAAAIKEAIAKGQTVFWVGHPCKHGHTSGYRVSNLKCVDCDRQDARDAKRRSRAAKKASQTSQPKTLNLRQRLVAFIGQIIRKAKTFTRA